MVEQYPALSQFLGGYLHQDWDLMADTIEGVVDVFNEENTGPVVAALRADVERILREHPTGLYEALMACSRDFEPGDAPEEFLRMVLSRLTKG